MSATFRAVWPITDETIPLADLCHQAAADLPALAAQAGARLARGGRFLIVPSDLVPGSGRVTAWSLVYDAPATPIVRNRVKATSLKLRTYETNDHHPCPRCGVVRDARPESLCRDCMPVARVERAREVAA